MDTPPHGTSAAHWWSCCSSPSSSDAETNEVRYAENDICRWKGTDTVTDSLLKPMKSGTRYLSGCQIIYDGSSCSRNTAQAGTYLLNVCSLSPGILVPSLRKVSDVASDRPVENLLSLYGTSTWPIETLELVCLLSGRFLILHLVSICWVSALLYHLNP